MPARRGWSSSETAMQRFLLMLGVGLILILGRLVGADTPELDV